MTLVRWQPRNRTFWDIQREANRLLSHPAVPFWGQYEGRDWVPTVDVEERNNEFVVSMDIPGVNKKDVTVALEDNILTIRGERKFERSEDEGTYYRAERSYGSFHRSFTLPRTVESPKIRAKHSDGVLTITIPKAEEAREKKIEIEIK